MAAPRTASLRTLAQALADTIMTEGRGLAYADALDALMSAYVVHYVAAGFTVEQYDRLVAPSMRAAIVEQRADRMMPAAGRA